MHEGRAPEGLVDISTLEFALDPVAGYNLLRSASPICWQRPFRGFLLTRLADAAPALRSSLLAETNPFAGWHSIARKLGKNYEATFRLFEYMPFIHEGEPHRRLRTVLAKGLAPFAANSAVFNRRVALRLEAAWRKGEFDLVGDFTGSLFFEVLCDLMGIPEEPRKNIKPLSHLSFALDSTLPVRLRDDVERTVSTCMEALLVEIRESLERNEGTLLHSIRDALPADELDQISAIGHLTTVMFLMGSDALSACIAIAVRHLLGEQSRHRQASHHRWSALADDAIRFVAPVDYLTRMAIGDVAVGNFQVRRGDRVIVSPLAANHDPAAFGPDAGEIVPRRGTDVGLAFGAGAHMCVGARIARNLVNSAFSGLSGMPAITLAGQGEQNPGRVVRSLASLPVRVR